jgi:hypothetical protein
MRPAQRGPKDIQADIRDFAEAVTGTGYCVSTIAGIRQRGDWAAPRIAPTAREATVYVKEASW